MSFLSVLNEIKKKIIQHFSRNMKSLRPPSELFVLTSIYRTCGAGSPCPRSPTENPDTFFLLIQNWDIKRIHCLVPKKYFCDANCGLGFKASECFTWLNIDLLTNLKCNSNQNKQGIRQICTCSFGRVCFSFSMENLTYQQRHHSCHIS